MKNGWKSLKLSDIALEVKGTAEIQGGETYQLWSVPSFSEGGPEIVEGAAIRSAKRPVRQGDVLLCKINPRINRVWVVGESNGLPQVASTEWITLRLKDKATISADYLQHYLASPSFREWITSETKGATGSHTRAKPKEVLRREVPVPPLPEQRRIVAILDEALEGITAAKANAERNLRNAKEAVEVAAASHLDKATADRPTLTVAELALPQKGSIRTGPFGSQLLHSEFVDEGVAVLGIDNAVANDFQWGERRFITHDKYRSLERYKVHPGDVIITIMGTCGRCAVIPDDIPLCINSKHLCCISLDRSKCLPAFLHAYFLAHPKARQYLTEQASGSIMDGLNMGIIKEMPVQLPPVPTQADVVLMLSALKDAAVQANQCFQAKIGILNELKASLLHQAFTGQL